MKKFLSLILAAFCVVAAFTACASEKDALATYAELIEKQSEGAFDKDILEVDVEVRGKTLVFKYIYQQDIADIDTVVASLEESLEELGNTVTESISQMSVEAGTEIEALCMEYYTKDGELIISREYK